MDGTAAARSSAVAEFGTSVGELREYLGRLQAHEGGREKEEFGAEFGMRSNSSCAVAIREAWLKSKTAAEYESLQQQIE
jgi:hypothetical protein